MHATRSRDPQCDFFIRRRHIAVGSQHTQTHTHVRARTCAARESGRRKCRRRSLEFAPTTARHKTGCRFISLERKVSATIENSREVSRLFGTHSAPLAPLEGYLPPSRRPAGLAGGRPVVCLAKWRREWRSPGACSPAGHRAGRLPACRTQNVLASGKSLSLRPNFWPAGRPARSIDDSRGSVTGQRLKLVAAGLNEEVVSWPAWPAGRRAVRRRGLTQQHHPFNGSPTLNDDHISRQMEGNSAGQHFIVLQLAAGPLAAAASRQPGPQSSRPAGPSAQEGTAHLLCKLSFNETQTFTQRASEARKSSRPSRPQPGLLVEWAEFDATHSGERGDLCQRAARLSESETISLQLVLLDCAPARSPAASAN